MPDDIMPTVTDDDLLFEQSYLIDTLPNDTLEAVEDGTSLPLAIVSAAYGYTREGQHSALLAGLFGFFGYQYPLLAAAIVATDAVFVQGTPAGEFAKSQFAKHSPSLKSKLGFSGLNTRRRCVRFGVRKGRRTCLKYTR